MSLFFLFSSAPFPQLKKTLAKSLQGLTKMQAERRVFSQLDALNTRMANKGREATLFTEKDIKDMEAEAVTDGMLSK